LPIPTPFYPREQARSESHEWRDWSGYLAASLYEPIHDREYYAIRNSAALIDVSPLYKYEISGPDARRLIDRIITRDASNIALGQVLYTPWCDDDGKVIDDGTVARLGEDRFFVTAAEPNLTWFQDCAWGMNARIEDVSAEVAALALQGPKSRQILARVLQGIDLDALRYYHSAPARMEAIELRVSRTGYTGDLGYELWVDPEDALRLWDALIAEGEAYGIAPAGMLALDVARIEAGLVMIQVDYISSRKALIGDQKSSPYEIGMGWAVDLNKAAFVGRRALAAEKERGSKWLLAGVEVDWTSLESIFDKFDLTPRLAGRASRSAVPVYKEGRQIGQMTSHTFSPVLKKYIGIATVERAYAGFDTPVEVEVTVEYTRQKAGGRLVRLPFYNPTRKKT
jgi:aminomethyltransferase